MWNENWYDGTEYKGQSIAGCVYVLYRSAALCTCSTPILVTSTFISSTSVHSPLPSVHPQCSTHVSPLANPCPRRLHQTNIGHSTTDDCPLVSTQSRVTLSLLRLLNAGMLQCRCRVALQSSELLLTLLCGVGFVGGAALVVGLSGLSALLAFGLSLRLG